MTEGSFKSIALNWLEETIAEASPANMDDLPEPREGEEVVGEASEFIRRIVGALNAIKESVGRPDISQLEIELTYQRAELLNELRWLEIRSTFGKKLFGRSVALRAGGKIVRIPEGGQDRATLIIEAFADAIRIN